MSDAGQFRTHAGAETGVISGREDTAAPVHEVGDRLNLGIADGGTRDAEQPDLVVIGCRNICCRCREIVICQHRVICPGNRDGTRMSAAMRQGDARTKCGGWMVDDRFNESRQAETAGWLKIQSAIGHDQQSRFAASEMVPPDGS